MMYETTKDFAHFLDTSDLLNEFRDQFHFPIRNNNTALYFAGNSLGLQPKGVKASLNAEVKKWRKQGVEGHVEAPDPWLTYHRLLTPTSAKIVGATNQEVVVMNTLTTNLHLLMMSFYRPTTERYKIIMEAGAFPSDQYAMESQVKIHGYDPADAIIEVSPRKGEEVIRDDDIISTIHAMKDEVALVMIGGVNYYTGQVFDMKRITEAAHSVGAYAGYDLAHAAGNVILNLHEWEVDFACWCSYKYLNSGPGGPGTIFIHEKYSLDKSFPRLAGWWGHNESRRFLMEKGFDAMPGAEGWQLSNAQIFSKAVMRVSLALFDEVGMPALRQKSLQLWKYMYFLLEDINKDKERYSILTPLNDHEHGCQLSIKAIGRGKDLFHYLGAHNVICDWREPNVIRIALIPFYNSFMDVYKLYKLLLKYH